MIANAVTESTLPEGTRIGVAMKRRLAYGDILIGNLGQSESSFPIRKGTVKDLRAFFKPDEPVDHAPYFPTRPPTLERRDAHRQAALAANNSPPIPPQLSPAIGSSHSPGNLSSGRSSEPQSSAPNESSADAVNPFSMASRPPAIGNAPPASPVAPTTSSELTSDSFPGEATPNRNRAARRRNIEPPAKPNAISVRLAKEVYSDHSMTKLVMFANRDRWLITVGIDSTVQVYEMETQKVLSKLKAQSELVQPTHIALSSDEAKVILGGISGQTITIDLDEHGKLANLQKLHGRIGPVTTLVASRKHNFFIAGSIDGTLIWEPLIPRPGAQKTLKPFRSQIMAAYLPEQGDKALATNGKSLVEFSLKSQTILNERDLAPKWYPTFTSFSPDGKYLVLMSMNEAYVYDVATGETASQFNANELGYVQTAHFHAVKKWLFLGGGKGAVIWDFQEDKHIATLEYPYIGGVKIIAPLQDDRFIAISSVSSGKPVMIYELGL